MNVGYTQEDPTEFFHKFLYKLPKYAFESFKIKSLIVTECEKCPICKENECKKEKSEESVFLRIWLKRGHSVFDTLQDAIANLKSFSNDNEPRKCSNKY